MEDDFIPLIIPLLIGIPAHVCLPERAPQRVGGPVLAGVT